MRDAYLRDVSAAAQPIDERLLQELAGESANNLIFHAWCNARDDGFTHATDNQLIALYEQENRQVTRWQEPALEKQHLAALDAYLLRRGVVHAPHPYAHLPVLKNNYSPKNLKSHERAIVKTANNEISCFVAGISTESAQNGLVYGTRTRSDYSLTDAHEVPLTHITRYRPAVRTL